MTICNAKTLLHLRGIGWIKHSTDVAFTGKCSGLRGRKGKFVGNDALRSQDDSPLASGRGQTVEIKSLVSWHEYTPRIVGKLLDLALLCGKKCNAAAAARLFDLCSPRQFIQAQRACKPRRKACSPGPAFTSIRQAWFRPRPEAVGLLLAESRGRSDTERLLIQT